MEVEKKSGFAAFLLTEHESLRERSGLQDRHVEGNILTETLNPSAEYRELDGTIPFGSLAFLVDTGVGLAGRAGSGWTVGGVTSSLSFETITALGSEPIHLRAHATAWTDEYSLSTGVFTDSSGQAIGQATLRAMAVPTRQTSEIVPPEDDGIVFPWESDFEPAPVDRSAGLGLVLGENTASMRTIPRLTWASAYGALHGGSVGLFVHRAIHYALLAALPPGATQTPASFEVSYLRPAMCGELPIECTAEILSLSKRLARIEGKMLMPDGKVAAIVRATHTIHRP